MAPSRTKLCPHASRATPSPLSSNLRMPHVFVIPPEEEQQDNPPWCCFDADEQPENNNTSPSNPDIHFLDVPYLLQQPAQDFPVPNSRCTSVHQPRLIASISKKLEKKQRPEAIKIVESRPSQTRQRGVRDSDVIEVVKVKRGRETLMDLEENTKVKRARTLRARATKALQSIKNVGKGSHRAHVKELWSSSESMPGIFRGVQEQIRFQQHQTEHPPPIFPTKKGSLSRNASRSLSQVFRPAKSLREESSFPARMASPVTLAEAYHDIPSTNPSSLSHLRYDHTNSSFSKVQSTPTMDDTLDKPVSRNHPMKKNTKFSVRELHRLFSLSSSSPDDPSSASAAFMPSPVSALSSNYSDDPMREDIYVDARFPDLESADRKLASPCYRASHTNNDSLTPRRLSDLSIEMRLDSLHFDALSFDPEHFDVSMDGDILQ